MRATTRSMMTTLKNKPSQMTISSVILSLSPKIGNKDGRPRQSKQRRRFVLDAECASGMNNTLAFLQLYENTNMQKAQNPDSQSS